MTVPARRRWLSGAAGLAFGAAWPLAGCSSEPVTRFQASPFDTPSELALWGLEEGAAATVAGHVWAILGTLDAQWRRTPAQARARLSAALQATGRSRATPTALTGGPGDDIAWRGLALDAVAGELRSPDLTGALLSLGQHLLALGERGFRPWHVGIPDPDAGHPLLSFDLYGEERLVTVASYARYRSGLPATDAAVLPTVAPTRGAGACASCSVIVRGGLAAQAGHIAAALFASRAEDWRADAAAAEATTVLWVGRDGRVEATTPFAKRIQMTDQRRSVRERP